MKNRFSLTTLGILALAAAALAILQQRRLTQAREELNQARAEAAQLPTLRDELSRLKRLEVDHAELSRLRQLQATSRVELAKLRGTASDAIRAGAEAARLRTELERQATQGAAVSNRVAAPMAEMMKATMQQQVQGRLTRMQEKLNLRPDQVQAIQEILTRQGNQAAEAMQKVFSGKLDKEELAKLRQGNAPPESQIQELLTPEQQTAYTAFKEEEATSNARLVANSELLQMQSSLGLSQDQQDKAFAVLYDQSLKQLKGNTPASGAPAGPTEAMQAALEQKLRALEGVLTSTQLDGYRQQQERQIKFMKGITEAIAPP